jgi:glycine dehydrogenase subunit 2
MAPFLPRPTVAFDGKSYWLDNGGPESIGKVRPFVGVTPNLLRAYAWIMSLGAEGLREVAEIAVLNNNYLLKRILEIRGASAPYAAGKRRIEQVRYSWEELTRESGITSEQIGLRALDYGVHYWMSHHPYVVPEPFTLEPTESYSKADLDEYAAILASVALEAREEPEIVRTAPHRSTVHANDHSVFDDPSKWAITWRAYRRKVRGEAGIPGA